MKFLRNFCRSANNRFNPLKIARDKTHTARQAFAKEINDQLNEGLDNLKKWYESEKEKGTELKYELNSKKAESIRKTRKQYEALVVIVDLIKAAINSCVFNTEPQSIELLFSKIAKDKSAIDDFMYFNPIAIAIVFDATDALNLLLSKLNGKIDLNAATIFNDTLMDTLKCCNDVEIISKISRACKKGGTNQLIPYAMSNLYLAVEQNDLRKTQRLVASGADIHAPCIDLRSSEHKPQTPYQLAMAENYTPVCSYLELTDKAHKYLTQHGLSTTKFYDIHPIHRMSAIIHAVRFTRLDVLAWLEQTGVDLSEADANGKTPLIEAITNPNIKVLKWLLQHNVIVNKSELGLAAKFANDSINLNEYTPRIISMSTSARIYSLQQEIYDILITWCDCADIELKNYVNRTNPFTFETPVTSAIRRNNMSELRYLQLRGARINSLARDAVSLNQVEKYQEYHSVPQFEKSYRQYATQAERKLKRTRFNTEDTIYTKQPDPMFQVSNSQFEVASGILNAIAEYTRENSKPLSATHLTKKNVVYGELQVLRFLSKDKTKNIRVQHKELSNKTKHYVLHEFHSDAQIELLEKHKLLSAKPINRWALRCYYGGLNVGLLLSDLAGIESKSSLQAAKIYIIATMLDRLWQTHKAGLTTAKCDITHFVWNSYSRSCKIVGFDHFRDFTVELADLATRDLCKSILDNFSELPIAVSTALQDMSNNPRHDALNDLCKNLIKNLTQPYEPLQNLDSYQNNPFTGQSDKVLTAALDLYEAIESTMAYGKYRPKLDNSLILRYVYKRELLIPATMDPTLRHLILILRHAGISHFELEPIIKALMKVNFVSDDKMYKVVDRAKDLYLLCLKAIKHLLPNDLKVQTLNINKVKELVFTHLKKFQKLLPDEYAALQQEHAFMVGFCSLYNIKINILNDQHGYTALGNASSTLSFNIKAYGDQYYVVAEVNEHIFSDKLKDIIRIFYKKQPASSEQANILTDFKLQDVYQEINSDADIQEQANKFRVCIEVYTESQTGVHTMLDDQEKVCGLIKINSYSPNILRGRPYKASDVGPDQILPIFKNNDGVYYKLSLNDAHQWLVPPDYVFDTCFMPRHTYVVPKNAENEALVPQKYAPFTLCHYHENNLSYKEITPGVIEGVIVYFVQLDASVPAETQMLGVAMSLHDHLKTKHLNLAPKIEPDAKSLLKTITFNPGNVSLKESFEKYLLQGDSLVINAALNNDLPTLNNYLSIALNPSEPNLRGELAIILAARKGLWEVVRLLAKHRHDDPENRAFLAYDNTTGESLLEVVESYYSDLDPNADKKQLSNAKLAHRCITLLQFLHYQDETADPSLVYATATELNKHGWIDKNLYEEYELRAQYQQLLMTEENIGGLPFTELEYSTLAMLLKVRFFLHTDDEIEEYGDNEWPMIRDFIKNETSKLQIIHWCIASDMQPENILAQIAAISVRSIKMLSETEKDELKAEVTKAIRKVAPILRRQNYEAWHRDDFPGYINSCKSSYREHLQTACQAIEDHYEGEKTKVDGHLLSIENTRAKSEKQLRDNHAASDRSGNETITRNYKKSKRKIVKTLAITLPAVCLAGWAAPQIGSFIGGAAAKGVGLAMVKGVTVGLAVAVSQGKLDPERFVKTVIGSAFGFAIGDAFISNITGLSDLQKEFIYAMGDSTATSILNGDLANALPFAVLDGTIQVLSSTVADILVRPPETGFQAGMSLREASHYFVVGASSSIFHVISDKAIKGNDLDLSMALISGLQSMLTHWSTKVAQQEVATRNKKQLAAEALKAPTVRALTNGPTAAANNNTASFGLFPNTANAAKPATGVLKPSSKSLGSKNTSAKKPVSFKEPNGKVASSGLDHLQQTQVGQILGTEEFKAAPKGGSLFGERVGKALDFVISPAGAAHDPRSMTDIIPAGTDDNTVSMSDMLARYEPDPSFVDSLGVGLFRGARDQVSDSVREFLGREENRVFSRKVKVDDLSPSAKRFANFWTNVSRMTDEQQTEYWDVPSTPELNERRAAIARGLGRGAVNAIQPVLHPIDTATDLVVTTWDGMNELSNLAFGVANQESLRRGQARGSQTVNMLYRFRDAPEIHKLEMGSEFVGTMLFGYGAARLTTPVVKTGGAFIATHGFRAPLVVADIAGSALSRFNGFKNLGDSRGTILDFGAPVEVFEAGAGVPRPNVLFGYERVEKYASNNTTGEIKPAISGHKPNNPAINNGEPILHQLGNHKVLPPTHNPGQIINTKFGNISLTYASNKLPGNVPNPNIQRLTKGKIVDYLENAHKVPRGQLIKDIESVGLKYAEGNGDGSVCKFVRYKNNKVIDNPVIDFRVEIHTAHLKRPNGAKYEHIHIYDKSGNSLDKNLIVVKNNSPDAHIKVKDLAEIILTLRPL